MRKNEFFEPIEKRVYHDQVFRFCSEKLKSYDFKAIDDHLGSIARLAGMFDDALEMLGDSEEKRFLEAYADKSNKRLLVELLNKLIGRISSFFEKHYEKRLLFPKTYYAYLDRYYGYRFDDGEDFSFHHSDRSSEIIQPSISFEIKYRKYISCATSFRIFYLFIECIICDLNNQEKAWQLIGKHYTDLLLEKENGSSISLKGQYATRPVTFLSYAFVDRPYSLHLLELFLDNGGFLYVDAIFGEKHDNGKEIKDSLEPWLDKSSSLLFLRSVHSDNFHLKQWCTWEIGRAYANCQSFFCANIIGKNRPSNHLLDDFRVFHGIDSGKMN